MDPLRKLIIERIRAKGGAGTPWVLDVYYHLLGHGVSHDDAVKAMGQFVDDCITLKTPRMESAE
jgi:hypothetical protein